MFKRLSRAAFAAALLAGVVPATMAQENVCSLSGGTFNCTVSSQDDLEAALLAIQNNDNEAVEEYVVSFAPPEDRGFIRLTATNDGEDTAIRLTGDANPVCADDEADNARAGAALCVDAPIRFRGANPETGGRVILTTRLVTDDPDSDFGDAFLAAFGDFFPFLPEPDGPVPCFEGVPAEASPRIFSFEREGDFILENLFLCDANIVGSGAAVQLSADSAAFLDLDRVFALNNHADGSGGAVYIDGAPHSVRVRNSSFSGNTAGTIGGGLHVAAGRATIVETTIGAYRGLGPGIDPEGNLGGNRAAEAGGGIAVSDSGPADADDGAPLLRGAIDLENVSIIDNIVSGGTVLGGAGVAVSYAAKFGEDAPVYGLSSSINSTIALNTIEGADGDSAVLVRVDNAAAAIPAVFPGTPDRPFVANIVAANERVDGDTVTPLTDPAALPGDVGFEDNLLTGERIDVFQGGPARGITSRGPVLPSVLPIAYDSPARDAALTPIAVPNDQRGADAQGDARDIGAYEFAGFGAVQFAPALERGFTVFEPPFDQDAEPDAAAIDADIALSRVGNTDTAISVTLRTVDGTVSGADGAGSIESGSATPDQGLILRDYAPQETELTFAAGATEASGTVTVRPDELLEAEETAKLLVSRPTIQREVLPGETLAIADADLDIREPIDISDGDDRPVSLVAQPCLPTTAADSAADCLSDLLIIRDRELVRLVSQNVSVNPPDPGVESRLEGDTLVLSNVPRGSTVTAPLRRLGPADFAGSVRCRTATAAGNGDNPATAGEDFLGVDRRATFPSGEALAQRECAVDLIDNPEIFTNEGTAFAFEFVEPAGRNPDLDDLDSNPGLQVGTPSRIRIEIAPSDADPAITTRYEFAQGSDTVFVVDQGDPQIIVRRLGIAFDEDSNYSVTASISGETDVLGDTSPQTLTWGPDDFADKSITLPVTQTAFEDDRTVMIALSDPRPVGMSQIGTPVEIAVTLRGTVPDEVEPASVALADATVEVAGDRATAGIEVVRSGDPSGTLSVDFATVDGSAEAGEDYEATTGTVSWAAGETGTKTIIVPVVPADGFRPQRDFEVELSNLSGTALDEGEVSLTPPTTATVVLQAAGVQPEVAMADASISVAPDRTTATIEVERSGDPSGTLMVDFATFNGSATAGTHYEATTGTVEWADGEGGTKVIEVPVQALAGGFRPERDFRVDLSNVRGTAVSEGFLTLEEPDSTTVVLEQFGTPAYSVSPTQTTLQAPFFEQTVLVSINARPSVATTFAISADNGVTPSPAALTFQPGGSLTREVVISLPSIPDENETATVTIDPQSGDAAFTALAARTVAVTIDVSGQQQDDGGGDSGGALSLWMMLTLLGGGIASRVRRARGRD